MFDWIPTEAFSWYWAAWLIVGFGVPEAVALARDAEGDTLSERVRHWAGTESNPTGRFVKVRRVALIAGMAWLVIHWLTSGGFV